MNYYNYYTEIEEAFVRRRGKNLLLSPLDWALIEGWQERGVPLHIVMRAIESVFDVYDKQPPGTRTIKTLFYCREEIEIQYSEWLKSQTGKSDGTKIEGESEISLADAAKHIADAITALKASPNENLREDFSRVITRLEQLDGNLTDDLELIDKTLHDIEKFLDRSLLEKSEKEYLKALKKETTAQLQSYKSTMEPDAYKHTFELMLLKRLREDARIPRLSLFYL